MSNKATPRLTERSTKDWNPQPDLNNSANIYDKHGNPFEHQAIISTGYEKRMTIENSGIQIQKSSRKMRKQNKIHNSRERRWMQGNTTSADLRTSNQGSVQNQQRSKTNDGRYENTLSSHSNYPQSSNANFPPQGIQVPQNALFSTTSNNGLQAIKQTSQGQNPNHTIQINNPISIYHVYFTQQSQRASMDLKKKLEPFEKSYLKHQKKLMAQNQQHQSHQVSPAFNNMAQNNRYANTIDYNQDVMSQEYANDKFDEQAATNLTVIPSQNEGQALVNNDDLIPPDGRQITETHESNQNMTMDHDSRGRSLPPLRQQNANQQQKIEIRQHELLQQTLIKNIKKRNKYNALLRSSNNTSYQSKDQFGKSNSQFLGRQKMGMATSQGGHTPINVTQGGSYSYNQQQKSFSQLNSNEQDQKGVTIFNNSQKLSSTAPDGFQNQTSQSSQRNQNLNQQQQFRITQQIQGNKPINQMKRIDNVSKSFQPVLVAQNRQKVSSPWSKNKINDDYYRLAQISKKQGQNMRQSSLLPHREKQQFYTIDQEKVDISPMMNNFNSSNGGGSQEFGQDRGLSYNSQGNLDNINLAVEAPFKLPTAGIKKEPKVIGGGANVNMAAHSRSRKRQGGHTGSKNKQSQQINRVSVLKTPGSIKQQPINQKGSISHIKIHDDEEVTLIGEPKIQSDSKQKRVPLQQLMNIRDCFENFKSKMIQQGNYNNDVRQSTLQPNQSEESIRVKELEERVYEMQRQLEDKDSEIAELRQQVKNSSGTKSNMSFNNKVSSSQIVQPTPMSPKLPTYHDKSIEKRETNLRVGQEELLENVNKSKLASKAAMMAISMQASPNDLKEMKELFYNLDQTSQLSFDDLKSSLIKSSDNETLYDIVKKAEREQNKEHTVIDLHDFLAATLDINDMILEDNLKKAFKMFDKKNNGKIEKHEAKAIYSNENLQHLISKDEFEKVVDEFYLNEDGDIDLQEFMNILKEAQKVSREEDNIQL